MNIINQVIKLVSPYMKSKGFRLSKKNYYYISNDIAYCISLEMPGGLLYVNAYIMPLYLPCKNRYYTYGIRLNNYCKSLFTLTKNDTDEDICRWCKELCWCIETEILPIYKQIETPNVLVEQVENKSGLVSSILSCPQVFIERLRMFTYLYIGDFLKIDSSIGRYRDLIRSSSFLTSTTRQSLLEESDLLENYTQRKPEDSLILLSEISTSTQKLL